MASGGNGTSNVAGELFKMMTGVNLVHVPYRGAGPALVDLLAGQVEIMFDTVSGSIGHITAGKLRPLGVTTAETVGGVAGYSDRGRFRAGLRGEHLSWHGRA
jgi:tripartite-type tricarboxylate transporter receptor subunit TctC